VKAIWERFWFGEGSLVRLGIYRMLLAFLALNDVYNYRLGMFIDAAKPDPLATWNPLLLLQLFGIGPPDLDTIQAVWIALHVAIPMAFLGLFSRWSCLAMGLLVMFWSAVSYSHGKAHHDKVAYTFATLALCLGPVGARVSLDSLIARWRQARHTGQPLEPAQAAPYALLPIRIAQVACALGYAFAGWSKIAISGFDWANGWSLMGMLMEHDNRASGWVSAQPQLLLGLSILTLFVQASFPLGVLLPGWRWLWVLGVTGFHLGTWVTMDTGPYITLWYVVWIAFLPLERLWTWAHNLLASQPRNRRLLALLALLVPVAPVVWVLSLDLHWAWFLWLCLPAVSLWRACPRPAPGDHAQDRPKPCLAELDNT
jgi:hypothetical protein